MSPNTLWPLSAIESLLIPLPGIVYKPSKQTQNSQILNLTSPQLRNLDHSSSRHALHTADARISIQL